MRKRSDIKGYIFCHKKVDYGIWDNKLYTPLEVGAALRDEHCAELQDNTGDNVSDWNEILAENTGTYWIWKNKPKNTKYVLQCQYRRRLLFDENTDFDSIFQKYDVIVPQPLKVLYGLKAQYIACHSKSDIELAEKVVKELEPEHSEDWDRFIKNGRYIYYSNGFVMRNKDYNAYAKWLFTVFDRFREKKGWNSPEDVMKEVQYDISKQRRSGVKGFKYQSQILAFLSERLFTYYILSRFDQSRIFTLPYIKFENISI